MVFQVDRKDPVILLSVSASVQDLRSLDMEKETKEIVRESPRGILEDCMRSLETESETSMASTSSYSEAPGNACIASYWGGFFNFWKKRSLKRLSTFPPLGVPKLSKRYTRSARENPTSIPLIDEANLCCFKPSWRNFSLTEISAATSNFSSENIIGKGGYAEVYKGCLQDGQLVAIKRLTRGTAEKRIADFLSEIGIIVHINHPNAAKLIGFCVEGGMHLVLQLSPHGILASRLHDSNEKLDWSIRYKVALGTAEGLNYLHVGCQRRIIHRDIKAANILLTEDFEPQICDFGLAKWLPDQWTHHTVSNFEGTFGYIAPEYFMHGIVNEKTDVFALGVLLLELITGRKALDCSRQSLVMWAKPLLDKNDMRELIDPSLDDVYDPQQMHHVALAASLSIQHSPLMRPNMGQIVQLLKGEGSLESIKLSQRPLLQRTYSEELFDANEYNSTRYLNDLNRHRQLALDF
ncbi:receptor-like cytosolic serine/threonine-protein kinase RBK2 isoform X2 [Magnolia sinica]|nr:receptor-like cytosolic serine/threonine-protein kinase RBK2 isoform X2 [Magnolia sinica]